MGKGDSRGAIYYGDRKARGLCVVCCKASGGMVYCKECRDARRERHEQLNLCLEPEVVKQFKEEARSQGMRFSGFFKQLFQRHLDEKEQKVWAREKARKLELMKAMKEQEEKVKGDQRG